MPYEHLTYRPRPSNFHGGETEMIVVAVRTKLVNLYRLL
jgi:hypothetical protein